MIVHKAWGAAKKCHLAFVDAKTLRAGAAEDEVQMIPSKWKFELIYPFPSVSCLIFMNFISGLEAPQDSI